MHQQNNNMEEQTLYFYLRREGDVVICLVYLLAAGLC